MKRKAKVLSLTFAVVCLVVASYQTAAILTKDGEMSAGRAGAVHEHHVSGKTEEKEFVGAAAKSSRGRTYSNQDLSSEVNLANLDSRVLVARLPADYRPQLGELAYLEGVGESEGMLRVIDVFRRSSSDSEELLMLIDDGLEDHMKDDTRIIFTGRNTDDALENRRRVANARNKKPRSERSGGLVVDWQEAFTRTIEDALNWSDVKP